jgi:hypothetical protein
VIALLALRRSASLDFSRAFKSFLIRLLLTIMRISLADRLLSYEALAMDMDTLIYAVRVP